MQYRLLGRSGLMVSVFGLGTTHWGDGPGTHPEWGGVSRDQAKRQVKIALDAGINLFDTADRYGFGYCEEVLAEGLGSRRDEAVIATKVFARVGDGPNDLGLSRRHIVRSCEGSLRRLKTDYIDVLQMHGWDGITPLEETLSALDALVQSGKVRYIGTSNWSAWHIMKALGISDRDHFVRYVSQQIYYSLQGREAEYELVPVAIDQGVSIVAYSPLGGALLTGKWTRTGTPPKATRRTVGWPDPPIYDEEKLWTIIETLVVVADEKEASVPQVALAYLLGKPGVASLLLGARKDSYLTDNLAASDLTLSVEEMARLDEVSAPDLIYPYWWQAKYNERLGEADLALLARYQAVPIPEGSLHRPLPGFGGIPGQRS